MKSILIYDIKIDYYLVLNWFVGITEKKKRKKKMKLGVQVTVSAIFFHKVLFTKYFTNRLGNDFTIHLSFHLKFLFKYT